MGISIINKDFKNLDTVFLNEDCDAVNIIDQTLLPGEIKILSLKEEQEIYDAIFHLKVRGAPAIGVFAALSMYILSLKIESQKKEDFILEFKRIKDHLDSARPTAVNLSWALKRMEKALLRDAKDLKKGYREAFLKALKEEALLIYNEDIETCKKIGENGLSVICDIVKRKGSASILTHCNAGRLATVRYGTATAPIYLAKEKGIKMSVYCDETRPLLQGARLTAFELSNSGIDTTLLCDNMSLSLMKKGAVDAVFVGADRIALNGDTANKIGTSMLSLAAKKCNVPFFVLAPLSTIDINTPDGNSIRIEERNEKEVTELMFKERMAPEKINVYNPAFDVTENEYINGIITERGILKPDYKNSIREMF